MRIGIDLGGTKIEGLALSAGGEELARARVPTPQGDYDGTVRAIAALVERVEAAALAAGEARSTGEPRSTRSPALRRPGLTRADRPLRLRGRASSPPAIGPRATIGVGTPGTVTPATGLMKNCNSTCLNGRPLPRDLEAALGRPVRLANDANCFALSEASDGAAAGARVVFGVILGTGVGGGLVVDGAVVGGKNGIAGEWGHNPLPAPAPGELPGPPCYCGRRGCVETWLSGPGFAADAARGGFAATDAAHVVAAMSRGDPAALLAFERYADRLARALATVINVVDPDVVVLGGGLSNVGALYSAVPARWGAHVFSDTVSTALVAPRHGDSSGVRGAAWLWPARAPALA